MLAIYNRNARLIAALPFKRLTAIRLFNSDHENIKNVGKVGGGPLAGITILDLTRVLAGPFCTMILGDMGAEIIKVEKIGSGDETRLWGPPFVKDESCYFLSINRNKKSIAIDMKHRLGKEIIQKLAAKSDVLVENFIPGKMDSYGLGFSQLQPLCPHLIYLSITGYGPEGPYSKRGGFDGTAAALGGLINSTGFRDGEPCKVGVAITDVATGLYAHGAILAALLERNKTGRGQKIDCNLLSTQISCMVNLASNYLNANQDTVRWGSAHESIVPYQVFCTADGYIMIGSATDKQFIKLCQVLECEYLLKDVRFKTNVDRVANRNILVQILSEKFLTKSTHGWLESFEGCDMPYAPVNNMQQAFADEQVKYNSTVCSMDHSTVGAIKVVGPAMKFSESANYCRFPPPTLGEHTRHVLKSHLFYSDDDVNDLLDKGVIQ